MTLNLVLLSNGSGAGGLLADRLDLISDLCVGVTEALFIPYASVVQEWATRTDQVAAALEPTGLRVRSLDEEPDIARALVDCEAVIVGGGNTFALLHHLRRRGVTELLRDRVRAGCRYLGWSAGANLACPTIATTNDMPVLDPGGLEALALVPFQINPHHTDAEPPGYAGESRDERIAEFLHLHPGVGVLGLPEGGWLRVTGGRYHLGGTSPAWWFRHAALRQALPVGPALLPVGAPASSSS